MISYTTGIKQVVIADTVHDPENNNVVGMIGGGLPWQTIENEMNTALASVRESISPHAELMLVSKHGYYWYHHDKNKSVHLLTDSSGSTC